MKKVFIGFIILGFLVILSKSLYNVVRETIEVLQYVPYIMDSPGTEPIDVIGI